MFLKFLINLTFKMTLTQQKIQIKMMKIYHSKNDIQVIDVNDNYKQQKMTKI